MRDMSARLGGYPGFAPQPGGGVAGRSVGLENTPLWRSSSQRAWAHVCKPGGRGPAAPVQQGLIEDRFAERPADTFLASRAAWMRPERGPDVVGMGPAETKQASTCGFVGGPGRIRTRDTRGKSCLQGILLTCKPTRKGPSTCGFACSPLLVVSRRFSSSCGLNAAWMFGRRPRATGAQGNSSAGTQPFAGGSEETLRTGDAEDAMVAARAPP